MVLVETDVRIALVISQNDDDIGPAGPAFPAPDQSGQGHRRCPAAHQPQKASSGHAIHLFTCSTP
jgi:hypothetical protein